MTENESQRDSCVVGCDAEWMEHCIMAYQPLACTLYGGSIAATQMFYWLRRGEASKQTWERHSQFEISRLATTVIWSRILKLFLDCENFAAIYCCELRYLFPINAAVHQNVRRSIVALWCTCLQRSHKRQNSGNKEDEELLIIEISLLVSQFEIITKIVHDFLACVALFL